MNYKRDAIETAKDIAVTILIGSASAVLLSMIPSILNITKVQDATAFQLKADAHRQLGLAKHYDAKATAEMLRTVMDA